MHIHALATKENSSRGEDGTKLAPSSTGEANSVNERRAILPQTLYSDG